MTDETDKKLAHSEKKSINTKAFIGTSMSLLILFLIAWFLFAGRISYAAAECSKGAKQCAVGVAVALGIVDVYDRNGHCTGLGCNF